MDPSEATFIETRGALQSVAEHVLCAARYRATKRIGLRAVPGGFATPEFVSPHGPQTVAVVGTELVVADDRGEQRASLTTVGDAAALVGIEPGAPREVFTPSTPLAPDAPLVIDADVASVLAAWWSLVDDALATFIASHAGETAAEAQLWPEHFDIGAQLGEVNYGGSPGDSSHELPYLYVGPWSPPEPDGDYWNRPFGAAIAATEITTADQAVAYFETGFRRLAE